MVACLLLLLYCSVNSSSDQQSDNIIVMGILGAIIAILLTSLVALSIVTILLCITWHKCQRSVDKQDLTKILSR